MADASLAQALARLREHFNAEPLTEAKECPLCGLHPYDFTVEEYKRELDRKEDALAQAEARAVRAEEALRQYADATNWGISRDDFDHPVCAWLGTGATEKPIPNGPRIAREALASAGADTETAV